ncbi:hypothetical protein [Nonomuraea lactucae]|uniref:hypothetical protein n=1 Tax=Nonomuraea lactucae TaxID=2249762 RepID=UPI0013B3D07F|nr:hypothetical protein [Nonomuraea lactucae]
MYLLVIGLGCVSAASGIYALATGQIPRLFRRRHVHYKPRLYACGQLLMACFTWLLMSSLMLMDVLPHQLAKTLVVAALACASAAIVLLFLAERAQR